jgi:hypothetical protein
MRRVIPAISVTLIVVALVVIPNEQIRFAIACIVCCGVIPFADINRIYRSVRSKHVLSLATAIVGLCVQGILTSLLYMLVSKDASAFMWGWVGGLLVFGHSMFDTPNGAIENAQKLWSSIQRRNSPYFLGEAMVTAGASQGGAFLLAATGGLAFNAASRGAFLLLFPVNMLVQAITLVLVVRVAPLAKSTRGLFRLATVSCGLFLGVCLYGVIIAYLPFFPDLLLGETSESSIEVLPGPTVCLAGTLFLLIPLAASRAVNNPRAGLVCRLALAPITLLVPPLLVHKTASVQGIFWGYILVGLSMVFVGVMLFLVLLRGSQSKPVVLLEPTAERESPQMIHMPASAHPRSKATQ